MTFERSADGLGVGTSRPRLSWRLPAGSRSQLAYELEVVRHGRTRAFGQVTSDSPLLVDWPGNPLVSRERAQVRVRVWTEHGTSSGWSEPAWVEAALLRPEDWRALPVGAGWAEQAGTERRPALVRREFTLDLPVVSARLYATAHGVAESEINGIRVSDDVLSPGWTVYPTRLLYRTYDVTALIQPGGNAIGAWLGDGWYRGRLGFHGGTRDIYGTDQSWLAQLEITHDDGSVTVIATDHTWTAVSGPILTSSLYDGETYDARLYQPAWSRPGGGAGQSPVRTHHRDPATLVAADWPPIRCTEEIRPATVTSRDDGIHVIDFGQNLVGRLAIDVDGPTGTTVTLRHAEVMVDGELATRPLRQARATDTFTLAGNGSERWEPRFTIHGFRYADVTGWPGPLDAGAIVARVLHTDMRRVGTFECDNVLVQRLHDNVVWSMRGNFVGLPTDCPARDERLGWTGDVQVFTPTAAFLYDCTALIDSWLADVAAEQLPDGTVPWYVPVIPGGAEWTPVRPGAAWGDVVTLTPWALYQSTGDIELLRRHHATAKAWVDLLDRIAGPSHVWDTGFQLGDWLDPTAPPDDPAASATDPHLIATAYFAWSAHHFALAAAVLDKTDDAARYGNLAGEVALAFRDRYMLTDGTLTSDSPTAYVLAIAFGLLNHEGSRRAGDRLADLVASNGYRIATGFVGTPLICDALTTTGHLDAAYRLLTQTECPSWLYPVTQGATTTWERWDSLRPDGTLNPGGMTSFNHFALGAVADWLHRVVAGIAPAAPGYRRITFQPRPGGGLTYAAAAHDTPYGTARIAWRLDGEDMRVELVVPPGCTADVLLPDTDPSELGPGTHHIVVPRPRDTPLLALTDSADGQP